MDHLDAIIASYLPGPATFSATQLAVLCIGVLVCGSGYYIRTFRNNIDLRDDTVGDFKYAHPSSESSTSDSQLEKDPGNYGYPPITPLPGSFDYSTTEPLKLRPFKPRYHLTMAISTLDPSELIPMDKTYKSRLELRKNLLADERIRGIVRGVNLQLDSPETNRRVREALCEWYAFVMGGYLPTRYPVIFRLLPGSVGKATTGEPGAMLESLVTGLKVPIDPVKLMESHSPSAHPTDLSRQTEKANSNLTNEKHKLLHLLDTLGTWIDEDFLILLPSPDPSPQLPSQPADPIYHLQAYTTHYPAGFNPSEKLSLPLSTIHAPVPGYKAKLEKSMDRFFARVEVGKFVVRTNWSVMTPGTGLFAGFGGLHDHTPASHGNSGEGVVDKDGDADGDEKIGKEIPVEWFDGEDTKLRVERQTLHRLPHSKAIVFGFHTYTYPLQEIKDEGLGEDMAAAIDGLKEGNVPDIYGYKRGPYWAGSVKAFLRS
ncbi:hypothetical protein BJX99DRAFT_125404 [Aspergillus californicus]